MASICLHRLLPCVHPDMSCGGHDCIPSGLCMLLCSDAGSAS